MELRDFDFCNLNVGHYYAMRVHLSVMRILLVSAVDTHD